LHQALFFVTLSALLFSPDARAEDAACTYQITDAKPGWTAYKTSDKAAVGGTFNEFQFATAEPATSLSDAIKGLSMSINPASVESNNAPRNATIAGKYFAGFANPTAISGKVLSVSGDDAAGTVSIQVAMNAVTKDLDFKYTVGEDGALEASATTDMLDFSLGGPLASLHEACKALHTGADGVAKTWTEVMLKVNATVVKNCP
jgi:polyisoprenoid-binding protein YceI